MSLVEHILCALDVEHPTFSALRCAVVVAERFGAALQVLHARESGLGLFAFTSPTERVARLLASDGVQQRLEHIVHAEGASVHAVASLKQGLPLSAILAHSRQVASNLIVLGSQPRPELGQRFRSDVSGRVAVEAPCAVLTVRETDKRLALQRILLPVDFSPSTGAAVDWALAFAQRFHAEINVVHVLAREIVPVQDVGPNTWPRVASIISMDPAAWLAAIGERLREAGVEVKTNLVVDPAASGGILEYAGIDNFDLVVMGMHGPPDKARATAGGVVATVRNRLSIPVLSVRASDPHASSRRTRFSERSSIDGYWSGLTGKTA